MKVYSLMPDDRWGKEFAAAYVVKSYFDGSQRTCSRCLRPHHRRRTRAFILEWQDESADRIPDVVSCSLAPDLVVSDRMFRDMRAEGLTGFTGSRCEFVNENRCQMSYNIGQCPLWDLFVISQANVRVDESTFEAPYSFCEACGALVAEPADVEQQFFTVDKSTWDGADLFRPVEVNALFVTEHVAHLIKAHRYQNAKLTLIGRIG